MSKEEQTEDIKDEVTSECLCCSLNVSLYIWGSILWTLGLLIGGNIFILFFDEWYPWWHPIAQFLIFIFYMFSMVIICLWCCNDSKENRNHMKKAGWFMLTSTTFIIFWNIIFIYCMAPKNDDHIKSGSGSKENPDNYDPIDKTQYLLGYVIWGIIIITFIIFFQITIARYIAYMPEEDEKESEDMMNDEEN